MKQNSLAQKVLSDLSMTQSPTLQDSADVLVCDEDAFEDEMTPQEWRALGEWMDREEGLASIRTIRTQCSMDGVTTLEEAIEQLEGIISKIWG